MSLGSKIQADGTATVLNITMKGKSEALWHVCGPIQPNGGQEI